MRKGRSNLHYRKSKSIEFREATARNATETPEEIPKKYENMKNYKQLATITRKQNKIKSLETKANPAPASVNNISGKYKNTYKSTPEHQQKMEEEPGQENRKWKDLR